MKSVRLKRAYDDPAPEDGCRILVERLWPRGVSKARAAIDLWAKETAPSTELRRWFDHDPKRWKGFQQRYRAELAEHPEALEALRERVAAGPATFVFASREPRLNAAVALAGILGLRITRDE